MQPTQGAVFRAAAVPRGQHGKPPDSSGASGGSGHADCWSRTLGQIAQFTERYRHHTCRPFLKIRTRGSASHQGSLATRATLTDVSLWPDAGCDTRYRAAAWCVENVPAPRTVTLHRHRVAELQIGCVTNGRFRRASSREGDGNVGIMRNPVRAIAPPDQHRRVHFCTRLITRSEAMMPASDHSGFGGRR